LNEKTLRGNKMNECYKVVAKEGHDKEERMTSISLGDYEPFCLYYRIGKKTIPKIGKIFVFKTLAHANRFGWGQFSVLRCQCGKLSVKFVRINLLVGDFTETARKFWGGKRIISGKTTTPAHTYVTDWVRPIKIEG